MQPTSKTVGVWLSAAAKRPRSAVKTVKSKSVSKSRPKSATKNSSPSQFASSLAKAIKPRKAEINPPADVEAPYFARIDMMPSASTLNTSPSPAKKLITSKSATAIKYKKPEISAFINKTTAKLIKANKVPKLGSAAPLVKNLKKRATSKDAVE